MQLKESILHELLQAGGGKTLRQHGIRLSRHAEGFIVRMLRRFGRLIRQ